MRTHNYLINAVSVVGTILLGTVFFFAIIGVFGLRFAIACLLIFLFVAAFISWEFPSKVQKYEP